MSERDAFAVLPTEVFVHLYIHHLHRAEFFGFYKTCRTYRCFLDDVHLWRRVVATHYGIDATTVPALMHCTTAFEIRDLFRWSRGTDFSKVCDARSLESFSAAEILQSIADLRADREERKRHPEALGVTYPFYAAIAMRLFRAKDIVLPDNIRRGDIVLVAQRAKRPYVVCLRTLIDWAGDIVNAITALVTVPNVYAAHGGFALGGDVKSKMIWGNYTFYGVPGPGPPDDDDEEEEYTDEGDDEDEFGDDDGSA